MQFCAELGGNLLIADAGVLLGRDTPLTLAAERVVRAVRMARLTGAVLYWHDAAAADPAVWREAPCAAITILGNAKTAAATRPEVLRRASRSSCRRCGAASARCCGSGSPADRLRDRLSTGC